MPWPQANEVVKVNMSSILFTISTFLLLRDKQLVDAVS